MNGFPERCRCFSLCDSVQSVDRSLVVATLSLGLLAGPAILRSQSAPPVDPAATTTFSVEEATPTPTPVPAALVELRKRIEATVPVAEKPLPAIEVLVDGTVISEKQTLLLPSTGASTRIEVRLGPALYSPKGRAGVGPAALGGTDLVLEHAAASRIELRASSGAIVTIAPGVVDWRSSGHEGVATITATAYGQFTVREEIDVRLGGGASRESGLDEGETRMIARSFSLVAPMPFDRDGDGSLGDAMIGIYPNERADDAPAVVKRNAAAYVPPAGFYRLDASTATIELAPGLTLGSLNPSPMPEPDAVRHVAVSPRVPEYWKALRSEISRTGMKPEALRVLRGFVSPHERARLARLGVSLANFSRHQYGDAFVLIYDANGDGRLDDLNNDGQATMADAEVLADWAERAMRASDLLGGLGVIAAYKSPTTTETPAVQIDVRGWFDRWKEE